MSSISRSKTTRSIQTSTLTSTLLLLSIAATAAASSSIQCYFPNSAPMPTPYQACAKNPDDGGVYACCAASDNCLENGLCRNSFGYNYRGGCTDDQWGVDCPVACSKVDKDTYVDLYTCPTTAPKGWCCGSGGTCCDDPERYLALTNMGIVSYDSSPASPTSSSSSPSSSSSSPSPSSSESSSPTVSVTITPNSKSNASKVGAAVGVPLGLIALAGWTAAAVIYLRFQRREKDGNRGIGAGGMEYGNGYQEGLHVVGENGMRIGMGQRRKTEEEAQELDIQGRDAVYEAPGSGR